MKLEKWALISEVVGGIAIVVTLIVLIVELRDNTAAIERQSAQERASRIVDPYLNTARLPEVYAKIKAQDSGTEPAVVAFADSYELTVEEAVLWVRHLELIWYGLQSDYLYTGPSESLEREILDLMSYPDERLFWTHTVDYWRPDFVAYVEALIHGQ